MGLVGDLPVPPERIEAGGVIVRRLTPGDAPALCRAATESLDHLRPWMPWAIPGAVTVEAQRTRLEGPAGEWQPDGAEYSFGVFLGDGSLVGAIGLHRRIGPGALEIGYWVHVAHTGRGIATAAAGALTDAGFSMQGVGRMEIHCDAANRASVAVPAKLGYRLVRTVHREPQAPGETGRHQVWAVTLSEWDEAGRTTAGGRPADREGPAGPR